MLLFKVIISFIYEIFIEAVAGNAGESLADDALKELFDVTAIVVIWHCIDMVRRTNSF